MLPFSRLNRLSHLERYCLAGILVFVLGNIQYRLLYALLNGIPANAGLAWMVHFVLGTIWSHALHRAFTFRGLPQLNYFSSLMRTGGLYVIVMTMSTALMVLLCDVGDLNPMVGWILGNGLSAICNFLLMSRWTICSEVKESNDESQSAHPDRSYQK